MTKVEKADLKKLSLEALIEGFVFEAKLNDPAMLTSVAEMNEHGTRSRAYTTEIVARGGAESLVPLLVLTDTWVAYSAADAIADCSETRDRALATLDRIADGQFGSASSSADTARNMIRYGNPLGEPREVERRRAEIRARDEARKVKLEGLKSPGEIDHRT